MFLFIDSERIGCIMHRNIQIHPMFLFINIGVTSTQSLIKFKYILCSYLSSFPLQSHPEMVFKYILCSYLSFPPEDWQMLLVYSNTSYVLIYLNMPPFAPHPKQIQIHPMFLFIHRIYATP